MEGPGVVSGIPSGGGPRDLSAYRIGVYIYEYERRPTEDRGQILDAGAGRTAAVHLNGGGLSSLGRSNFVEASMTKGSPSLKPPH